MPIHRPDHAIRFVLKILALVVITLPLLSLIPAGATEKATSSTSRPVNLSGSSPTLEENDPPLQIGKTLYQRNGEIRQVETQ